ncbi:uncharacterized protein LOC119607641 [Lucilia sericata]|uniref:uncharacterized protein LOC119607641 n=1 Tax=Lucilia sericata TaxID=13632 RepID=UPI0018A81783|nr:uncharacterized protein LOC119607641 [Lucilia sericata]
MSNLLDSAINWHPDDYVFFRKCGEITISPDIQNIGFNCLFCTGVCLQSDIFLQHLQEQHKEQVFKLYELENSNLTGEVFITNTTNAAELVLNISATNLNNSLITNSNAISITNQLAAEENQESKENYIILNGMLNMPSVDLNLVNDLATSDLLTLTSANQDLENLITLNSLENLANNTSSNTYNTLTNSCTTTFSLPSNCSTSASVVSPDDNECEIGDGEDSGIMLVQSPGCNSSDDGVCGGFSDCMSFTEDSSSKSSPTYHQTCSITLPDYINQPLEPDKLTDIKSSKSLKGKYLKTPAMLKALNNKDLIVYLLEAYRKNEKLWNPKHKDYKYNAHRTMYSELSQPLLHEMKYSLTGEEIFGIINELRGRYRRELHKFETRKGKHKTRLWYFDKMDFLRQTIEEKRKERNKDKEIEAEESEELTNRQVLSSLLDLYRHYESLWNPLDKEYDNCNKTTIFEEISEQLKENIKVVMSTEECKNEIQKLCIRYRKELRILYKLKGLYLPKLWCFDEMEFLRPKMEEKIIKNLKKVAHPSSNPLRQRQAFLKASDINFDNLEQQLQFIEIYRSFNSLWDVDHPDYRSSNYRKKALNEMLEKVNLNLKPEKLYKLEQLEKTLYLLRKEFSREKLKRLKENPLKDKEQTCGMSFVLYEKLAQFLAINLGPFRCNNCQLIVKTYDQYKIHKSKHEGTLPFICTLCGKGFQMPGNLTIHIRRHRHDFPYSCEICKKSFATSTEVNIHKRSHTGERPYKCEWCEKTFKTWSFYDLHRRTTHLNQSNFHCPICDKAFYERNRFTDHMNVHLNIRKHPCDECGKSFTTLGNLKKHLDLHAKVKKYKCQPCGKRFAQFASLRWHRKTQHEQ